MCNQGKPCRKKLYFFLSPYIFFTCRNHCNICTSYEFFCHKKGINTLGGMKNHWKGRKITALVFIFQVKLVLHLLTHVFNRWLRKMYICMKVISDLYSIFKEMTHFEVSQKHILIQKLVLFIREPPILNLRQNKNQTFVFEPFLKNLNQLPAAKKKYSKNEHLNKRFVLLILSKL